MALPRAPPAFAPLEVLEEVVKVLGGAAGVLEEAAGVLEKAVEVLGRAAGALTRTAGVLEETFEVPGPAEVPGRAAGVLGRGATALERTSGVLEETFEAPGPAGVLGRAAGVTAGVLGRASGVLEEASEVLGGAAEVLGRAAGALGCAARVLEEAAEVLGGAAGVLGREARALGREARALGRASGLEEASEVLEEQLRVLEKAAEVLGGAAEYCIVNCYSEQGKKTHANAVMERLFEAGPTNVRFKKSGTACATCTMVAGSAGEGPLICMVLTREKRLTTETPNYTRTRFLRERAAWSPESVGPSALKDADTKVNNMTIGVWGGLTPGRPTGTVRVEAQDNTRKASQ
ncbi:hypothetical protein B0H13DRAFT_1858603 [Mycena leptocephala]|nr:hypothetical protein B0H13DRAFT_1858603 [Mycena leptocephala]